MQQHSAALDGFKSNSVLQPGNVLHKKKKKKKKVPSSLLQKQVTHTVENIQHLWIISEAPGNLCHGRPPALYQEQAQLEKK